MIRLLICILVFTLGSLCSLPSRAQALPPLLLAIKNNDTTQVGQLLRNGADVAVTDDDGDNVLMYAALYSTAGCMRQLLNHHAAVNAKNKLGETAILWCTHDFEKTRLLLEQQADVNLKTTTGNTAFLAACVGANQQNMVKLMLAHQANPLLINDRKETALILTALFGDTLTARWLLNISVDINARGGDGQTALFYAIKGQNLPMLQWLLANGADANIVDDYKLTPLGLAVINDNPLLARALLPVTKNINDLDIDGISNLIWACYNEHDNPDVIQLLLNAGADVKPMDKKGQTALDWAVKKGNTKTVALLKKAGAIHGVPIAAGKK